MHPPLGFHFRVVFKGLEKAGEEDTGFISVSGLEAFMHKERREQQQQPGYLKPPAPALVLKRAVKTHRQSALTRWLASHFNKNNESPLPEAHIELLNDNHEPCMQWTIRTIYPKSWKLSELNAERSDIVTETIELYYEELIFAD